MRGNSITRAIISIALSFSFVLLISLISFIAIAPEKRIFVGYKKGHGDLQLFEKCIAAAEKEERLSKNPYLASFDKRECLLSLGYVKIDLTTLEDGGLDDIELLRKRSEQREAKKKFDNLNYVFSDPLKIYEYKDLSLTEFIKTNSSTFGNILVLSILVWFFALEGIAKYNCCNNRGAKRLSIVIASTLSLFSVAVFLIFGNSSDDIFIVYLLFVFVLSYALSFYLFLFAREILIWIREGYAISGNNMIKEKIRNNDRNQSPIYNHRR